MVGISIFRCTVYGCNCSRTKCIRKLCGIKMGTFVSDLFFFFFLWGGGEEPRNQLFATIKRIIKQ